MRNCAKDHSPLKYFEKPPMKDKLNRIDYEIEYLHMLLVFDFSSCSPLLLIFYS
jgi:hypothetical protein